VTPRARAVFAVLAALVTLVLVATAPAGAAAAESTSVPGRLIVGFRSGVSSQRQSSILSAVKARVEKRLGHIRAAVVAPRSKSTSREALKRALKRFKEVSFAEPDFYLKSSVTPNDPMYPSQYALAPSGVAFVDAPTAWNSRTNCSKIAVLDTGVQYNHPDLSANVWHNSKEIANNGKDDDHNGYVDDYYGFNVINGKGSGIDDNGHGTHVSGIIAGRGNNGQGVAGVCWSAQVIPVKFLDSHGRGSTSNSIAGIEYAVKVGAKIINCSFGSPSKSSALLNEVEYAKSKGVLIVAAAGNEGENIDRTPEYPASYTIGNILTVAAVTPSGGLASFSDYGSSSVDMAAPGEQILSTYLNSTYKKLSGTSMATPFVAGTAAMLHAKDSSLSYSTIRSALRGHVRKLASLSGKTVSGGVLDVAAALNSVK
jgi:subtilisin family serine protease